MTPARRTMAPSVRGRPASSRPPGSAGTGSSAPRAGRPRRHPSASRFAGASHRPGEGRFPHLGQGALPPAARAHPSGDHEFRRNPLSHVPAQVPVQQHHHPRAPTHVAREESHKEDRQQHQRPGRPPRAARQGRGCEAHQAAAQRDDQADGRGERLRRRRLRRAAKPDAQRKVVVRATPPRRTNQSVTPAERQRARRTRR